MRIGSTYRSFAQELQFVGPALQDMRREILDVWFNPDNAHDTWIIPLQQLLERLCRKPLV